MCEYILLLTWWVYFAVYLFEYIMLSTRVNIFCCLHKWVYFTVYLGKFILKFTSCVNVSYSLTVMVLVCMPADYVMYVCSAVYQCKCVSLFTCESVFSCLPVMVLVCKPADVVMPVFSAVECIVSPSDVLHVDALNCQGDCPDCHRSV